MNIIKGLYTVMFALAFYSKLIAQTTVTLGLTSGSAQDVYISDYPSFANTSQNPDPDIAGIAWTSGGVPYIGRGLFQFDLSSIPLNATIISAKLSLYGNPCAEHTVGGHSTLSGSNAAYLQRITSSWKESTACWNNQPTTTTVNQVSLAQSTSALQDYLNINVTNLVADMHSNPTTSFGFMLKLQTEQYYRSLNFASSNCTDSLKHPKLVVTYSTQPCITLSLTSGNAQDVYISDYPSFANTSQNPDPDIAGIAWTSGGVPYIGRGLFQFDLTSIPSNATIVDAKLSLYGNPYAEHTVGGHSTLSGSNAAYLQRITSSWKESTACWNNQPTTTTVNQVSLAQSTSALQDYLNINVTNLVADMYSNPTTSFGFMLKLQTEQYYRSLNFASSNSTDTLKHPKLKVCYLVNVGIPKDVTSNNELNVFPNPTLNNITLSFSMGRTGDLFIRITDIHGRVVFAECKNGFIGEYRNQIDMTGYSKGIYFLSVITNNNTEARRIIVE